MNCSIFYLPSFCSPGWWIKHRAQRALLCAKTRKMSFLPDRSSFTVLSIFVLVAVALSLSFFSLFFLSVLLYCLLFSHFLRWHILDWSTGNKANLSSWVLIFSTHYDRAVYILNPPASACRVSVRMTAVFGFCSCCAPHWLITQKPAQPLSLILHKHWSIYREALK